MFRNYERLFTIFFAGVLVAVLASGAQAQEIFNLNESNIRSDRFSISWLTVGDETGSVNVYDDAGGTSPVAGSPFLDIRDGGGGYDDDVHYVDIDGLSDNTTYYYEVVSDATTFDDDGSLWSITTAVDVGFFVDSHHVYTQVEEDGSGTLSDPRYAVVYIWINKRADNGQTIEDSGLGAVLTDASGYAWYELANLRNVAMADRYAVDPDYGRTNVDNDDDQDLATATDPTDDQVVFWGQGGNIGEGILVVGTDDTRANPTTDDGGAGVLNLVLTLPATPTVTIISPSSGSNTGTTAVTITGTNFQAPLTVAIDDTSNAYTLTDVTVVDATTITAVVPAGGVEAAGYNVIVTNPGGADSTASTVPFEIVSTVLRDINIAAGAFDLISIPVQIPSTAGIDLAHELGEDINTFIGSSSVDILYDWTGAAYTVHLMALPTFSNFSLARGRGIWIHTSGAGASPYQIEGVPLAGTNDITIDTGFRIVGSPVDTTDGNMSAHSFGLDLNDDAVGIDVTVVYDWTGAAYTVHLMALPTFSNFDINVGDGYWVFNDGVAGTASITDP